MKVDTIEFEGKSYDVSLVGGKFHADVDGEDLCAETFERIKKLVIAAVRQDKLSIPICRIDTDSDDLRRPVEVTELRLVGTHAGSGNYIIEHVDGHREQVRTYQTSGYHRPLDPSELKTLVGLVKKQIQLRREIEEFRDARQVNLKALVEAKRERQAK